MKKPFAPNFGKFAPVQIEIWPHLAPIARHGFVLYGGMGLSARLGHRGSLDFDFFASRPIDRVGLAEDLPFLANATTLQNERDTYTISIPVSGDEVKISFFGPLNIKRIAEPDVTEDGVCQVASLDDLAATKLSVVLARIQASDYRDVLAIVRAGLPLEDAIADASAIYGTRFQPSDILKALTYFEGGDLDELTSDERAELRATVAGVRTIPHRTATFCDLSANARSPSKRTAEGEIARSDNAKIRQADERER